MIAKMIMPDDDLVAARHELAERHDHVARPPAAPSVPACVRISRVVATFSTSRASVVASSSEGKMLNSSGVPHVDRRQQHDHGDRDVRRQQHVHQRSRQRHQDHQHAGDDGDRQNQILAAAEETLRRSRQPLRTPRTSPNVSQAFQPDRNARSVSLERLTLRADELMKILVKRS